MSRPLIAAHELMARNADEVLIVDCRFDLADPQQGRRAYLAGHLPGAVYASLDEDLSDLDKIPQGLGRHPLPEPDAFARTLERWGWRPELTVVAYDTVGGAMAARLWWMMRSLGAKAAVLDGGLNAWREAGGTLQTGAVERAPSTVEARLDPQAAMDSAALQQALADGAVTLVDARAAPRFRGEVEPLDRVGGHVPGAVNRPFADNLGANGRFRAPEDLRADFERLLAGRPPEHSVHMCGSGVTACHNLLAMAHAGLPGARLYAPSWSGWISDPERPVAKGEA
ncbi:sulfurtransferase [Oleiagrimonas soli]|uniref:Thiosulfate/3-mercaptopyruvate sulfurtransferase n=1 Tax=Oleiagrimonas soli TaxID=1543381 RepID=A0A099CVZ3_9GAMM|nr:sulfurtransferase [Oleiagrimonas soli]KGI77919.1 hypothetical protein LF63_0105845 [Oleiagrimonas soli]MBB6183714.1 thiosulfate/3-mercaptopyruvate sulfurtransferase [Oleiagrimonas soli]